MFRVVGCDARGSRLELSICADTEANARAIALGAGMATIDRVNMPPLLPKLNGWVVGIFACVGCLAITSLGAVLGFFIGNAMEPDNNFIRVGWLLGGAIGAAIGLVCGVTFLVACLHRLWHR